MFDRRRITDLHRAGDLAAARPLYVDWLAARPDDGLMWTNFGALLRAQGLLEQALRAQRRAQRLLGGTNATLRNNLANILTDLGQNEEAIALRRAGLEAGPDDPQDRAMIGRALRASGRAEEAVEELRAARAAHPDHVEIRLQLALLLLSCGRYAEGFAEYAVRWQTDEMGPRRTIAPRWAGEPIEGRSVLVLPEQGFGDVVAFSRFLPLLHRMGAGQVILQAKRPLARLLARLEGVDRVVPVAAGPEVDLQVEMMDLPTIAFARDPAVPPPARLAVAEDSRERARRRLAHHPRGLRVGVVWTGSEGYRANAARSFPHERLLELSEIPGVQLFSLYKGPAAAAFHADGSAAFIPDLGSSDRDFADCAALMLEMDLILTSDTATAHIAGSLGRPVWTLLHHDAFWLWGQSGATTPWYPSMRLFRQARPRDWDGVFAQVSRALSALVAAQASGRRRQA
ncbi:tetratricopeptide repeat protein [Limimaricola litoreus]|uniref:Tetratricopeptide repeat-containing glycosyltransferase family protein n=1 Tax=Limimaricola litoreus TaxID=2955316 RepID=A0A9X2FUY8_9RHOB|nr:tetratricopeptide repeat-containing glycosyltransferase family protein [Limimaricola litoreus]